MGEFAVTVTQPEVAARKTIAAMAIRKLLANMHAPWVCAVNDRAERFVEEFQTESAAIE